MVPDWLTEIDILRGAGVSLAEGLTSREIAAVEDRLSASLPPDLREFLSIALPLGGSFPNWRALDDPNLERTISWPSEGIAFDIEHNAFWWRAWGPQPSDLQEAMAVARKRLAAEPFLVPVYAHRYLPAEPHAAGNPVLSAYQTDIIYYGSDLRDYIRREFDKRGWHRSPVASVRRIRFWSELIDCAGEPSS